MSEYTENAPTVPRWTKSYVFIGDSLLSTATPNGAGGETTEYSHPDRLGTRVITNQQAGTSSEQTTLPFGTALNAESTVTNNNKRFTSYDRSAATGLDYAVNRHYDSKQGRFTQVDPIGMSASSLSSPQTLNLYSYCGNDPINHTDPSGLFWGFFKKLFKWLMVALAVIVAVLTIVSVPATIAGIFAGISAGASAASTVLNALGYKKAGLIFGLIAVVTGFGSVIAAQIGKGNSLVATGDAVKDGLGWIGALSGVGAVKNSFASKSGQKKQFPCAPDANQLLARFGKFLSNLLEYESGHQTDSSLENGGWIYQRKNGDLFFLRAEKFGGMWNGKPRRQKEGMLLQDPPSIKGARVVGLGHTHPYSIGEQNAIDNGGAYGGPSGKDYALKDLPQVPSLVAHQINSKGGNRTIQIENAGTWTLNNENCKRR